jgi:hypothetical protein
MAQVSPHHSDSLARDRLEQELQDENQRIKEACFQLTHIDPQAEPSRYEALVCAMVDALDRQVARDSVSPGSPTAAQQTDLFDGIGVEPGALNALIAQLRNLSAGDEASSNRFQVLNDYVSSNLARDPQDALARSSGSLIKWDDLADRMDALRQRLYRETEEDRSQTHRRRSADGAAATGISPAPSRDSH